MLNSSYTINIMILMMIWFGVSHLVASYYTYVA